MKKMKNLFLLVLMVAFVCTATGCTLDEGKNQTQERETAQQFKTAKLSTSSTESIHKNTKTTIQKKNTNAKVASSKRSTTSRKITSSKRSIAARKKSSSKRNTGSRKTTSGKSSISGKTTTSNRKAKSARKSTAKKNNASKNTASKSTRNNVSKKSKNIGKNEQEKKYTLADLKDLRNTDIFSRSAIEHIFEGQINSKGEAVGYHYDQIENTPGSIVSGTKSSKDSHGVYKGKVTVLGTDKTGNQGYSTFYPDDMSPQQVVDGIYQAYKKRVYKTGNIYYGYSDDGIKITMYLNDSNKIISAFPDYNTK